MSSTHPQAEASARAHTSPPSLQTPAPTAQKSLVASFRTNALKTFTAAPSSGLDKSCSVEAVAGTGNPPFSRSKTARPVEQVALDRRVEQQRRTASDDSLAVPLYGARKEREYRREEEKGDQKVKKQKQNLWMMGGNQEEEKHSEGSKGTEQGRAHGEQDSSEGISKRKQSGASATHQRHGNEGEGEKEGEEAGAPSKKHKHRPGPQSRSGTPRVVHAPQPQYPAHKPTFVAAGPDTHQAAQQVDRQAVGKVKNTRRVSPDTEGEEVEQLTFSTKQRNAHHESGVIHSASAGHLARQEEGQMCDHRSDTHDRHDNSLQLSGAVEADDERGDIMVGSLEGGSVNHNSAHEQDRPEVVPTATITDAIQVQGSNQQKLTVDPALSIFPTALIEQVAKYRAFHTVSPPLDVSVNGADPNVKLTEAFVRLELKYCDPVYETAAEPDSVQYDQQAPESMTDNPAVGMSTASQFHLADEDEHAEHYRTYPSSAHCTQQEVIDSSDYMQDSQNASNGDVLVQESFPNHAYNESFNDGYGGTLNESQMLFEQSQLSMYYAPRRDFVPDTFAGLDSQQDQAPSGQEAQDTYDRSATTEQLGSLRTPIVPGHFELVVHLQCAGAEFDVYAESWVKVFKEIDNDDVQAVLDLTNKVTEIYQLLCKGGELHYSSDFKQVALHQLCLVRNDNGRFKCKYSFKPLPQTTEAPIWEPEVREAAKEQVVEQCRVLWDQQMQKQIMAIKRKATDDIARASTNKVRKAAKEADVAYARFRKALDDKRKEFAENEKEMKRILEERLETHRQRSVPVAGIAVAAA